MIISSYEKNNYGDVFYNMLTVFKPLIAVELGVLHGYSTYHIARALHENKITEKLDVKLDAYDLFEDYPYSHGMIEEVKKNNLGLLLAIYVNLIKGDAFKAHENYQDNSVYFLHIDLSNTGEIIRKMMANWDAKMIVGGLIFIEGGSQERDEVEWMKKYNKEPIKPELESNPIIEKNYIFGTYLKFPSLTVLLKKR